MLAASVGVVVGTMSPAQAVACPTLAQQGDSTTVLDVGGVDHVVHHFTTTGSAWFTPPATVTEVSYLVVGGGGGGGARYGGGGGGGGVVTGTQSVAPGVGLSVTVGAGGTGGVKRVTGVAPGRGSNGSPSALGTVTALGGGGGGAGNQGVNSAGRAGSSGGGGGGGPLDQTVVTYSGGAATQGHAGGAGTFASNGNYFQGLTGGGGGGAGGAGGAGDRRTGVGLAGAGGAGVTSTISGTTLAYGGGGGGRAFHVNLANLGSGGGGDGTNADTQPAKAQRGGGGGGGGLSTQGWDGSAGGDGGDGLVVVSYPMPPLAPCAPVITSIVAGDGHVSVVFDPPTSDGGAAVTDYDFSADGGVTWQRFTPTVRESPVVIDGLTNGTVAALALRAVNIAGAGPSSNVVEATPQLPPPPVLPEGLPALITAPVASSRPITSTPPSTTAPPSTTSPPTSTALDDPDLEPGEVLVTRNGEPVDAMVFVNDPSSLTLLHGDSRLRVSTRCALVCPPMVPGEMGGMSLQVDARSSVHLTASGLRPGAPVTVWVFSTPRRLADDTLGADGSYQGVVPLTDVSLGHHTLRVNSVDRSGDAVSFHVTLMVVADQAGPTSVLPSTGSPVSTLSLFGTGMFLAGMALTLFVRRPRPKVGRY